MSLQNMLIFPIGSTDACSYAAEYLKETGISFTDHPAPEVTHLLLDVPSFRADGSLRSGQELASVLERLPAEITVIGGNLSHPNLNGYHVIDLLKDSEYLALNAAITADCALQIAARLLTTTFSDSPTLIIGWGRIGKCLGILLKQIGTDVTIAARKAADRAMIRALGFSAVDISEIPSCLSKYRLIYNTVPEMILPKEKLSMCKNCIKIDLASKTGMGGDDVIPARGLPGIHAPESSGRLIGETFLRLSREGLS